MPTKKIAARRRIRNTAKSNTATSSTRAILPITLIVFAAVLAWGIGTIPENGYLRASSTLQSEGASYEAHVWVRNGVAASAASAQLHAASIDVVSPMWYQASSNGNVDSYVSAYDRAAFRAAVEAQGALLIPTIENARALAFLDTPEGRDAQSSRVVQLAVEQSYPGVDIDYELLPVAQRDAFSAYVPLLAQKLHAAGKTLSVTVHPKWNDSADWSGAGAQDWAVIVQHADRMRIMIYGWDYQEPGPVSPFYWIRGVVKYATSLTPTGKIVVGLPWYGRDFVTGKSPVSIGWNTVQQHLATYNPIVTRHLGMRYESGELTYSYTANGETHTVFFPDAESYRLKTEQVTTLYPSVAGFTTYVAGVEDPGVWAVVDTLRGSDTGGPTLPAITLTSPVGGETWKVGETHTLTWSASNVDSITVSVQGDSSAMLATLPGTATSYGWQITQGAGSYTVTVTAANAAGVAQATSAPFSVVWQCNDPDAGASSIYVQTTTTSNGGAVMSATDYCPTSTECATQLGKKTTSCLKEFSCDAQGLITATYTKCNCSNGACEVKVKGRK